MRRDVWWWIRRRGQEISTLARWRRPPVTEKSWIRFSVARALSVARSKSLERRIRRITSEVGRAQLCSWVCCCAVEAHARPGQDEQPTAFGGDWRFSPPFITSQFGREWGPVPTARSYKERQPKALKLGFWLPPTPPPGSPWHPRSTQKLTGADYFAQFWCFVVKGCPQVHPGRAGWLWWAA